MWEKNNHSSQVHMDHSLAKSMCETINQVPENLNRLKSADTKYLLQTIGIKLQINNPWLQMTMNIVSWVYWLFGYYLPNGSLKVTHFSVVFLPFTHESVRVPDTNPLLDKHVCKCPSLTSHFGHIGLW